MSLKCVKGWFKILTINEIRRFRSYQTGNSFQNVKIKIFKTFFSQFLDLKVNVKNFKKMDTLSSNEGLWKKSSLKIRLSNHSKTLRFYTRFLLSWLNFKQLMEHRRFRIESHPIYSVRTKTHAKCTLLTRMRWKILSYFVAFLNIILILRNTKIWRCLVVVLTSTHQQSTILKNANAKNNRHIFVLRQIKIILKNATKLRQNFPSSFRHFLVK